MKVTPDVGWRLIRALLPSLGGTSIPTAKPRLREAGASERVPITYGELSEAQTSVVQRAISLAGHDEGRWAELIRGWSNFPPAEREASVAALEVTLDKLRAGDRKRLWLKVRDEIARHERFRTAQWVLPDEELASLRRLLDKFSPEDPITLVLWLFDTWTLDDAGDLAAADHRRASALKTLHDAAGSEGIIRLGFETRLPHLVVKAVDAAGLDDSEAERLFELSFACDNASNLTFGFAGLYRNRLGKHRAEARLARALAERSASTEIIARSLLAWPDEPTTWAAARRLGPAVVSSYWRERVPQYLKGSRFALFRSMLMLLRFGRAAAALQSSFDRLAEIPTRLLFRLLDGIIPEINSKAIQPDNMLNFYLEGALNVLDARPDASELEIAQRENAYLPLLEFSNRKLRLHDRMASDPAFYHQILRNVFPGDNEPNVEADEHTNARARMSYSLLSRFSRIPGQSSFGIDGTCLTNWIDELRHLGVETDRRAVTDNYIGRTLAHVGSDADGGWPDRAVRAQIERLASDEMERGLQLERFNMRGAHFRQVFQGGDQERDLARSYANNAKIAEAWPRTSALLSTIARGWEEEAKSEDVEAAQRKLRS